MSLPLTGLGLGIVIPFWESWPSTSQRLLALEGLRVLLPPSIVPPLHYFPWWFWGAGVSIDINS